MYANQPDLTQIIATLTDEYRNAAVKYVEYLAQLQRAKAKTTLNQIQGIFADDKGWASEEEMLKDMADFRWTRLAISVNDRWAESTNGNALKRRQK